MNNTILNNELLSDQFCDLRDKYGLPFVYDKAGKEVVGINQRFFAALYCQARNLLFDKDEKKFFLYDQSTGLWQEQSSNAQLCDVAQLIMQYVPNDYIRLSTSRMISQIQSFIKGLAEKRGAFQNKKKNVIHVANGILEFISGGGWELRNPQPEDYSRNRSEITYKPESQCPQFLDQLLGEAMPEEDISLLQQYAGLVLLGYNLSQKVLLLTGSAGGGKSTLVNILEGLIGRHNCCELRTEHLDQRFEIARFVGKTLLTAKDVKSSFLNTPGAAKIKALTGKDTLTADFKGVSTGVDVIGNFNVVITANTELHVALDGDKEAWRRRLLWIKYELPPTSTPIADFDEKILTEEGAGVLNWALEGARKLLVEGGKIRMTAKQTERVDKLLLESDTVGQFVHKCIVLSPGLNATSEELWSQFCHYCDYQGWAPGSRKQFFIELKNAMLTEFHLSQSHRISRNNTLKRGYEGIRIQKDC